jgi:DNA-directed RNA polymerase subunit RPC12/RpoP
MSKKYVCKGCGFEIAHHTDQKMPAPSKCPKCKSTSFTGKHAGEDDAPIEQEVVEDEQGVA